MRARVIVIGIVAVAALAAALIVRGGSPSDEPPAAFESRTISAGEVDVVLAPHHVDGTGAEFAVTLDTHSVELDQDLTSGATLRVGSADWPAAAWSGDGPSGHHREGRLSFDAAGPVTGPIVLTLDGFDENVTATWEPVR